MFLGSTPFKQEEDTEARFRFVDLFAGIGGIRLGFQGLGGQCVFSSEWDKFAQKTYAANFGEFPCGDITQIKAEEVPDHDILLAGFPCQAFSQAGLKKGFHDTRGTLFFDVQRVLAEKRPKAFLLENVKQLQGQDKGRTLKTINDVLSGNFSSEIFADIPLNSESRNALTERLNYWVDYKVLRAGDFGIPQNRERVFIVGFDKDYFDEVDFSCHFRWPVPPKTKTRVGDILEDLEPEEAQKFTISDRLWEGHQRRKLEHQKKGSGFGYTLFNAESAYTNTLLARYHKDGAEILVAQEDRKNPRKLTPRECANLQGFPINYIVDAVSKSQMYKQFGNSVCVKVIDALAKEMVSALEDAERRKEAERLEQLEQLEFAIF